MRLNSIVSYRTSLEEFQSSNFVNEYFILEGDYIPIIYLMIPSMFLRIEDSIVTSCKNIKIRYPRRLAQNRYDRFIPFLSDFNLTCNMNLKYTKEGKSVVENISYIGGMLFLKNNPIFTYCLKKEDFFEYLVNPTNDIPKEKIYAVLELKVLEEKQYQKLKSMIIDTTFISVGLDNLLIKKDLNSLLKPYSYNLSDYIRTSYELNDFLEKIEI